MKRIKNVLLLALMFAGTLSFTACGSSDNDNEGDDKVEIGDGSDSSDTSDASLKKSIAKAIVGVWVDQAEHAEWKAYMSQNNKEYASKLMNYAYKFESNGTGANLSNRKDNSLVSWEHTESFTWTVKSCRKVEGRYEGTLSMTGGMSGELDFMMSGDLKQLFFVSGDDIYEMLDKL